jgi:hypothetical protein
MYRGLVSLQIVQLVEDLQGYNESGLTMVEFDKQSGNSEEITSSFWTL